MLEPDIYRSWTFAAYHLLKLREGKVSFHGVTPFYLINFAMCVGRYFMCTASLAR